MASTSAETSGRLLEKLEGPEVEKNRLLGALGTSWDAWGWAGGGRGAGGAKASSGTRVAGREVELNLEALEFENGRPCGGACVPGARRRAG